MLSVYLILPAVLGSRVYSTSNRNEYHEQKPKTFLGIRLRPTHKAVKLTAICKPIVLIIWNP
jgi:hypothetical protein